MTAATTPARRLLAMLEDERSLETRPLSDILADLAAHGIDPSEPTRQARRLAERAAGPAAALLGAVIEDEASEAEIAALETADIEDVRGRLEAGTVAAAAAEAKRRAGMQSNVVGLRRRRSAAWTWAGSLVGIAASALIVVAVWWPGQDMPMPEPAVVATETAADPGGPESSLADAPPSPAALEALPPRTGAATIVARPISPDAPAGQAEAMAAGTAVAPSEQDAARASITAKPAGPPAASDLGSLAGEAESQPMAGLAVPSESTAAGQSRARTDPVVAPVPPPFPGERRAAGTDGADRAAAGRASEAGTPSPEAWLEQLASPSAGREDTLRGLSVQPLPAAPALSVMGGQVLVTDGVLYPQSFGWDLGEPWSDGAFPVLSHVDAGGARVPIVGLLPDPPVQDAASGDLAESDLLRTMPLDLGSRIALARPDAAASPDDPRSVLAKLTRGLYVMLSEAQALGADPWAGDVAERLVDARRLAAGRTILALLTIRVAGVELDVALLPSDAGSPIPANDLMRSLLTHWFGDDAAEFALNPISVR